MKDRRKRYSSLGSSKRRRGASRGSGSNVFHHGDDEEGWSVQADSPQPRASCSSTRGTLGEPSDPASPCGQNVSPVHGTWSPSEGEQEGDSGVGGKKHRSTHSPSPLPSSSLSSPVSSPPLPLTASPPSTRLATLSSTLQPLLSPQFPFPPPPSLATDEPLTSLVSLGFVPCPDMDPDAEGADFTRSQNIHNAQQLSPQLAAAGPSVLYSSTERERGGGEDDEEEKEEVCSSLSPPYPSEHDGYHVLGSVGWEDRQQQQHEEYSLATDRLATSSSVFLSRTANQLVLPLPIEAAVLEAKGWSLLPRHDASSTIDLFGITTGTAGTTDYVGSSFAPSSPSFAASTCALVGTTGPAITPQLDSSRSPSPFTLEARQGDSDGRAIEGVHPNRHDPSSFLDDGDQARGERKGFEKEVMKSFISHPISGFTAHDATTAPAAAVEIQVPSSVLQSRPTSPSCLHSWKDQLGEVGLRQLEGPLQKEPHHQYPQEHIPFPILDTMAPAPTSDSSFTLPRVRDLAEYSLYNGTNAHGHGSTTTAHYHNYHYQRSQKSTSLLADSLIPQGAPVTRSQAQASAAVPIAGSAALPSNPPHTWESFMNMSSSSPPSMGVNGQSSTRSISSGYSPSHGPPHSGPVMCSFSPREVGRMGGGGFKASSPLPSSMSVDSMGTNRTISASHSLVSGRPVPHHANGRQEIPNVESENKVCHNCGATESPSWRRCPQGKLLLCNACGLYHKLHGRPRPFKRTPDGKIKIDRVMQVRGPCFRCGTNDALTWKRSMTGEALCEHCEASQRMARGSGGTGGAQIIRVTPFSSHGSETGVNMNYDDHSTRARSSTVVSTAERSSTPALSSATAAPSSVFNTPTLNSSASTQVTSGGGPSPMNSPIRHWRTRNRTDAGASKRDTRRKTNARASPEGEQALASMNTGATTTAASSQRPQVNSGYYGFGATQSSHPLGWMHGPTSSMAIGSYVNPVSLTVAVSSPTTKVTPPTGPTLAPPMPFVATGYMSPGSPAMSGSSSSSSSSYTMNTLPPLVGLHSQQQAQQHQQGRFRNLRSLQNYEIAVAGYASSSAASPDPFVRSMSVTTTTTTTTTTTPQGMQQQYSLGQGNVQRPEPRQGQSSVMSRPSNFYPLPAGVQPLYSHEPNHEQNHRMYMERQRQEYQQLLRLRHQVLQQQALHTYGPYQSGLQVPVRQQAVHPHPHPAAAFQRFVPVPLQHEHLQHQRVDPNHQTRQLMQGNAAFSMDVQLLLEQQRWIERQRVPHEMPASPLTPSTTPETSSVVATTASTYGAANTTTVPARAGVSPGRASVPSEENPKEDDDKANAGGSVLGPKEALSYGHLERREEKEEEEESVEDEDKDEDQEREQAKKGENLGAGDYHYANLLSPEPDGTSDTEVECTTRATTRAFLKQKNRGMKENVE